MKSYVWLLIPVVTGVDVKLLLKKRERRVEKGRQTGVKGREERGGDGMDFGVSQCCIQIDTTACWSACMLLLASQRLQCW